VVTGWVTVKSTVNLTGNTVIMGADDHHCRIDQLRRAGNANSLLPTSPPPSRIKQGRPRHNAHQHVDATAAVNISANVTLSGRT
jgi:hypothetical protein